jgi:competence protein ComEA
MQFRLRQWVSIAAIALLLAVGVRAAPVAAEGDHRIDINTASATELATLPGIGESKAKAIVDYRAADPFRTIDDLKKVKGIGDKTFEALKPNLMVSDAGAKKDGAKK